MNTVPNLFDKVQELFYNLLKLFKSMRQYGTNMEHNLLTVKMPLRVKAVSGVSGL